MYGKDYDNPPTPEPVEDEEAAAERARKAFPRLNWHALFADDTTEEWVHEPLLPARRSVVIYSPPKVGKSLLMLEFAVALSRAETFLSAPIERRYRVLYIDFENDPRGDVRSRLQSMGYGPDDLDHLDYLSFPTMAGLDTERGSLELIEACKAYGAEIVVIDTVSRAVNGEENSNDTWLGLYRHTGLKLKQAGIAVIRLDHTGKDETKGQRGGSAKSGDVDAIWRLSRVADDRFRLECTDSRLHIATKSLHLIRQQTPRLRHTVESLGSSTSREQKVAHLIALADDNGLPADASREAIREFAKERGITARNDVFAEVARHRKIVPTLGDNRPAGRTPEAVPDLGDSRDDTRQEPPKMGEKSCPQPSGTVGDSAPSPLLSPAPHPMGAGGGTAGQDSPECPECGRPIEPMRAALGYPCLACVVAS